MCYSTNLRTKLRSVSIFMIEQPAEKYFSKLKGIYNVLERCLNQGMLDFMGWQTVAPDLSFNFLCHLFMHTASGYKFLNVWFVHIQAWQI